MGPHEVTRLIDSHAAPLILYARQWSDAAEDVVQDAFVKLVSQTRPPGDPVAWLYRVVRNGALDGAKLARRRQHRESAVARPVAVPEPAPPAPVAGGLPSLAEVPAARAAC